MKHACFQEKVLRAGEWGMPYLTKKEKLSEILTREREIRGLSQQDVAHAVDASLRNYQRWESGETFPQPYSLRKLQGFFGECINEVMVYDPQEYPLQDDRILAGDQNEPEEASPQEEQDDQSTPELLSETDNRTAETANNERQTSPITHITTKHYLPVLCTIVFMLILIVIGFVLFIHITNLGRSTTIKPGGAWFSPRGDTVGDVISFAVYAYPTHPGDPAIDHVNFTIYWQGVDPRQWIIACVAHKPIRDDLYACTANLRKLGTPAGKMIISFDVYDRKGNKNLAPNGEHIVIYSPTSG
jgi:transcriptional regulator with XRE-family HTH domain